MNNRVKQHTNDILEGAKVLVEAITLANEKYSHNSKLLAEFVIKSSVDFLRIVKMFSDYLESENFLDK